MSGEQSSEGDDQRREMEAKRAGSRGKQCNGSSSIQGPAARLLPARRRLLKLSRQSTVFSQACRLGSRNRVGATCGRMGLLASHGYVERAQVSALAGVWRLPSPSVLLRHLHMQVHLQPLHRCTVLGKRQSTLAGAGCAHHLHSVGGAAAGGAGGTRQERRQVEGGREGGREGNAEPVLAARCHGLPFGGAAAERGWPLHRLRFTQLPPSSPPQTLPNPL